MQRQATFAVSATGDNDIATATISTAGRDREGDEIVSSGVDVQNYLRNPIVLFAHDYQSLPVGRATNVDKGRDSLTASWQWAEGDPFAERVKNCWQQGMLNAVSVGVRPKEVETLPGGGGVRILTSELLEFSVVPVPANADALRRMKAAGLFSQFAPAETVLEVDDSPVALELADEPERYSLHDPVVRNAVLDGVASSLTAIVNEEIERSICYLRGRVDYPTR